MFDQSGICCVCSCEQDFSHIEGNPRDGMRCQSCSSRLQDRDIATCFINRFGGGIAVSVSTLAQNLASTDKRLDVLEIAYTSAFASFGRKIPGYRRAYHWADGQPRTLPDGDWAEHLDLCDLAVPDASLDALVFSDVLQFVPDLPLALAEISRVLKPGGTLLAGVQLSWPVPDSTVAARPGQRTEFSSPDGQSYTLQRDFGTDLMDGLRATGVVPTLHRASFWQRHRTCFTIVGTKLHANG